MLYEPLTEQERQELFPPPKPRRRRPITRSLNIVLRELQSRHDALGWSFVEAVLRPERTQADLALIARSADLCQLIADLKAELGKKP